MNSYLLASHIHPQRRAHHYPDVGHGFLFQDPHQFAAEVNKFLTDPIGETNGLRAADVIYGNVPTSPTGAPNELQATTA